MTETERYAWIQLALTPYIGAESFAALLDVYGSASEALTVSSQTIAQLGRYGKQAAAVWHDTDVAQKATDAALNWERQENCRVMLSCDPDYPQQLTEGMTAPPILFVRGEVQLLQKRSVGIVGSRHATPQALRVAGEFAQALSERDITIISGMALGIDTAAHTGALRGIGRTIAVWGTGIDRIYPAQNQDLAREIAEQGAIISEFPLGTRPLAGNFPRRNRIIAAHSQGILVVEAALASGSLITARQAADMGREVMAIPGSIDNPHSRGCHQLIKEGARLIDCIDDILHELDNVANDTYPQIKNKKVKQLNRLNTQGLAEISTQLTSSLPTNLSTDSLNEISELLRQMGYDPVYPDTLAEQLGMNIADVYAQLTEWELEGIVAAVSGGRYQRVK